MKKSKILSGLLVLVMVALYIGLFGATVSAASVLTVGPSGMYATPAAAYAAAAPGDIIEIDAAGTYFGTNAEVLIYGKDNITFRGVNGRPHMEIDSKTKLVWDKGIWVIAANNITVDNIEFSGATFKRDKNGCGIRVDPYDNPVFTNCYFHNCDDGILTSYQMTSDIVVLNCEFAYCGYGDGYSHSIYVGACNSLTFRYNYSHEAKNGHLLKTRSALNYVEYNRLTDNAATSIYYSTYNIDIPEGGTSYVIGNVLQQGVYAQNYGMFGYALEYNSYVGKTCYIINNTFVNDYTSGVFIYGRNDPTITIVYKNNIFTGVGTIESGTCNWVSSNNYAGDPSYVSRSTYNYHLTSASTAAIDQGTDPGTGDGYTLMPDEEYVEVCSSAARVIDGASVDLGAFEY